MKTPAAHMYGVLLETPGHMDTDLQVRIADWAIRQGHVETLTALARRDDLNTAVFDRMLAIGDVEVRTALLRRPGKVDAVWPTLKDETRIPVLIAAAERGDAPDWVYRRCVTEGNSAVFEWLVINPRVPADVRSEAAVKLVTSNDSNLDLRRLDWLGPLLVQHPDIAEAIVTADVETEVAVRAATVAAASLSSGALEALIDRLEGLLDLHVARVVDSGTSDLLIIRDAKSVLGQLTELAVAGPLTSAMIRRIGDLAEAARAKLAGAADITGTALLGAELNGVAAAVQTGLAHHPGLAAVRLRRCGTSDELRRCLDEMMHQPMWQHPSRYSKGLGTAALAAPGCTRDLAIRVVDGTPKSMLPEGTTVEALANLHVDAGRIRLATELVLLLVEPHAHSGRHEAMMSRLYTLLGHSRSSLIDAAIRLHREEGRFSELWHWARIGHMTVDVISSFPVRFLAQLRWSQQAAASLSEYLNERFGGDQLRWDWFEALLERPFHGTVADLADAAVRMSQLHRRP